MYSWTILIIDSAEKEYHTNKIIEQWDKILSIIFLSQKQLVIEQNKKIWPK